jgi:hypothetical protein
MKFSAKIVSLIFHPIFLPIYLLIFTIYLPVNQMLRYPIEFKIYLLGYTIIINLIIPIISLWIFKKYHIIDNFEIFKADQRTIPYLLMFALFSFTAISLSNIEMLHPIFGLLFSISAAVVAMIAILNRFFKISAHSASSAAAVVWFFIVFKELNFNSILFFILSILILGLVMSSRLILQAHKNIEVWMGMTVGVLIPLIVYYLIY